MLIAQVIDLLQERDQITAGKTGGVEMKFVPNVEDLPLVIVWNPSATTTAAASRSR